jgi:hypothetical protein
MKSVKDAEKKLPAAEPKSWFSWTNDGPNSNIHSLQVLLDWLTSPGNYNCFTGGAGQRGKTKQSIAVEIQNKICEAGIVVNRTTDSIIHKIKELVSSYKDAHQVKHRTGQGIVDKDKLDDEVYGICKYYDLLDPILSDRPAIKPRLTNKQIINGDIIDDAVRTSKGVATDTQLSDDELQASAKNVSSTATAKAKINSSKCSTRVRIFLSLLLLLFFVSLLNIIYIYYLTKMQKKKLKKSIVPANSAKVNAKQMERNIMFATLKIRQWR